MHRGESPIPLPLLPLQRGGVVAVWCDACAPPRGVAVVAAARCTPETVAFLAREARGVVCAALPEERARALELRFIGRGDAPAGMFCESVEARTGVSTGISAADRARTLQVLASPQTTAADLTRPGHIVPVVAHDRGVIQRRGEAESALDAVRLAGLESVAGWVHVLDARGELADEETFTAWAERHGLPVVRTRELLAWRLERDNFVWPVAESTLATRRGAFRALLYEDERDGLVHPVLVYGDLAAGGQQEAPLVRVHSQCITGDVFHSLRCDCGDQLTAALDAIEREGAGVLVYLRQEGRGIGLANKIRAYELQDLGRDTVDANLDLGFRPDPRSFAVAARVLSDLGLRQVRLLTNNPRKVAELERFGVHVAERVPLPVVCRPENHRYLAVKAARMGHLIDVPPLE